MQERLWFLDQLEPGAAILNTPAAVRLRGELDVERMRGALDALVVRHESLRTRFPTVGGAPVAVIEPASPVALPVTDLRELPEAERERAAEEQVQAEGARPFDLAGGPVVRARLLRVADDEHVLVVAAHHIVADGWSSGILLHELGRLYAGHRLPAVPIQYADYAAWERGRLQGERLERQLAYWRQQLDGAPAETALPADRPRPRVQTYRGERVRHRLDPELTSALRGLARARGATMFMTLLAGFDALVARWSGQEDVVVGAPVGGRARRELEAVVGPFLNAVALRVSLAGGPSFAEVLARVRRAAVEAYQHQEVPFESVLQAVSPPRDLSRTPVFQLFFNMLNYPATAAELPGLRLELMTGPLLPSKFDLTVYASESGGGIDLELVYNADLFDRARIEELAAQYDLLLRRCAGDPDGAVTRASLVTRAGAARAAGSDGRAGCELAGPDPRSSDPPGRARAGASRGDRSRWPRRRVELRRAGGGQQSPGSPSTESRSGRAGRRRRACPRRAGRRRGRHLGLAIGAAGVGHDGRAQDRRRRAGPGSGLSGGQPGRAPGAGAAARPAAPGRVGADRSGGEPSGWLVTPTAP